MSEEENFEYTFTTPKNWEIYNDFYAHLLEPEVSDIGKIFMEEDVLSNPKFLALVNAIETYEERETLKKIYQLIEEMKD